MNPEMTMAMKRHEEREALRSVIQQWNANRLDLFELSEPNEVNKIKCWFLHTYIMHVLCIFSKVIIIFWTFVYDLYFIHFTV